MIMNSLRKIMISDYETQSVTEFRNHDHEQFTKDHDQ